MSNRQFKLKLWQQDPKCHWCHRETKLLNIPEIQGEADPLMATIDHLVSRYHPHRWVKRDQTKVLACYECNAKRAREETKALPREELVRRGQGFSLNPRGKPIFVEALDSLDAVLNKMKENGIEPYDESRDTALCEQAGNGCDRCRQEN
jgi:hypothetical protein